MGIQPSDEKRKPSPSKYVRRPSCYEMQLMDAQKQDKVLRSTLRERRPLTKFPIFMALICSVIDSVTSSDQGESD